MGSRRNELQMEDALTAIFELEAAGARTQRGLRSATPVGRRSRRLPDSTVTPRRSSQITSSTSALKPARSNPTRGSEHWNRSRTRPAASCREFPQCRPDPRPSPTTRTCSSMGRPYQRQTVQGSPPFGRVARSRPVSDSLALCRPLL